MGDFPARPVWLPKVGHSTSPLNKMGPCKLPQRRAGFMIVSPTMMNNDKKSGCIMVNNGYIIVNNG